MMLGQNSRGRGARPQGWGLDQIFDIEKFSEKYFFSFSAENDAPHSQGVVSALKIFLSFPAAVYEKKLDQGCWVEIQEVEELDLRGGGSTKFST
jgi:hypothetical protein